VFSSKANSAYTQLFLTHIDAQGRSTPPVVLSHLTSPDRAANIPEFVNVLPSAIEEIREQFLDDYSFVRAGNAFFQSGATDDAIRNYNKALELNPDNAEAHLKLGFLLYHVKGMRDEGMQHSLTAMRLEPNNPFAHYDLGMSLTHQKKFKEAATHLSEAVRLLPQGHDQQYNPVDMRYNLGRVLLLCGKHEECIGHLHDALRVESNSAKTHYFLAQMLVGRGEIDTTVKHYTTAVRLQPDIDRSAELHVALGVDYANAGRFREARSSAEKAISLARAAGNGELARRALEQIQRYKQGVDPPKFGQLP